MYRKNVIFFLACAGIFFFGAAITTLGSVLPHLKVRFQIDDIAAGTIFSILPFGILAGSLIFGPIADRYGYRVLLALTCFSMAIGFFGVAKSPTFTLLKVSTFIFGLGGGAINGATSALISDISGKNKGANLSILGVFFAIGALGMPFILGLVEGLFNYTDVLLITGMGSAIMGVAFILNRFPPAKHASGIPISQVKSLFKNAFLLTIAFFLFFQSAFEGIINNWTTTYLSTELRLSASDALFILSASVLGMTVMRLMLASLLKNASDRKIWTITFALLFSGLLIVHFSESFFPALAGFTAIGAGLAAGFPIMLSYVGERFKHLSATAFSIAFSIALTGNMILNYLMGYIAQNFGIAHILTMQLIGYSVMLILCIIIIRARTKTGTREIVHTAN